jgi:hypothetical protein
MLVILLLALMLAPLIVGLYRLTDEIGESRNICGKQSQSFLIRHPVSPRWKTQSQRSQNGWGETGNSRNFPDSQNT